MNLPVIVIVGIAFALLIIFLVRRNMIDKKELENKIKDDYPKNKEREKDIETDEKERMK